FAGQDTSDLDLSAIGTYTTGSDTQFNTNLGYSDAHQPLNDTSNPNFVKPIHYVEDSASFGVAHTFNRFTLRAEGGYDKHNYFDTVDQFGASIDEDFADSSETHVGARVSYLTGPKSAWYVAVDQRQLSYDHTDGGVSQDSQSTAVVGGLSLQVTDVITGD